MTGSFSCNHHLITSQAQSCHQLYMSGKQVHLQWETWLGVQVICCISRTMTLTMTACLRTKDWLAIKVPDVFASSFDSAKERWKIFSTPHVHQRANAFKTSMKDSLSNGGGGIQSQSIHSIEPAEATAYNRADLNEPCSLGQNSLDDTLCCRVRSFWQLVRSKWLAHMSGGNSDLRLERPHALASRAKLPQLQLKSSFIEISRPRIHSTDEPYQISDPDGSVLLSEL